MTDSDKKITNFVEPVNGVRVVNGTKLYKCAYKCECGDIGRRYVKEDDRTTSCHKCKKELTIYPSTKNDAHDEQFNYFIAY